MSTLVIRSPYDSSIIAEVDLDDIELALLKIDRLSTFFKDTDKPYSKTLRIEILERFRELLREHRQDIMVMAIREGGKPLRDTRIEMDRAIDGVGIAIRELQGLAGREIPMGISPSSTGRMAFTHHVPKGIVLAISAFNHPINLFIHQVIPAIAAGCPVLFKPALETPLTGEYLTRLLYKAGLPEGALQICVCANDVAERLVSHSEVAVLNYIGSARVGWHLRTRLPPGAACVLEHGGAAPAILDESADLAVAVPALTKGAFYHAGQVCVSVQRIYVHNSIKAEFLSRFCSAVEGLRYGNPLLEETDIGPMIRSQELGRLQDWVNEACVAGAHLVCGGRSLGAGIFAPTILLDPPSSCRVSREEVFGPLVSVYGFDDISQAYAAANAVDYAFQACVFTEKIETAMVAFHSLEALGVLVNDHAAFRVDWMPFGGYRSSGLGVGGIGASLRDLMHEKLCVIKSARN